MKVALKDEVKERMVKPLVGENFMELPEFLILEGDVMEEKHYCAEKCFNKGGIKQYCPSPKKEEECKCYCHCDKNYVPHKPYDCSCNSPSPKKIEEISWLVVDEENLKDGIKLMVDTLNEQSRAINKINKT